MTLSETKQRVVPTIFPGLRFPDAPGAVEWLCRVFGFDAHFARAKAAGAEMLYGMRDTEYGSREYACRDPEGHFWSFGTYDPYA